MSNERLFDKAVTNLALYIRNNYATKLRAVETEAGLAVGALEDPAEVLEANVPTDLRSPLIEVFDVTSQCTDRRNNQWSTVCQVAMSFTGDADLVAGEKRQHRYATALVDTIRASATLGGTVADAGLLEYATEVMRGADSKIRHVFAVTVHVTTKN